MIEQLQDLGDLGLEMTARARRAGVTLIWRAQTRASWRTVVHEGKTESSSVTSVAGHGAQVVTDDGRTALASRDDFRPEAAIGLLDRVVEIVGRGSALQLERTRLPDLEPIRAQKLPDSLESFERVELQGAARRLTELEKQLKSAAPGTTLRLSYRAELDAWRIFRSDGTDVLFAMPRCTLGARATSQGDGTRHGVSAMLFDSDPGVLWKDDAVDLFLRRVSRAAELARRLPDAPSFPAGAYPLVIDYALAKGLAHEAFGHASEADGYRSSVLAKNGRFRTGESVGADHVSIIDEPLDRDHAWQPFSANGLTRERVMIVDHGRLTDGLSDPWSAGPGGVRLTGAARAESFRHAPQPRMSNIRIEVDSPLPAPGEFEDYGPEQVRDLLISSGVFRRHARVVYLSGYSGGQVNPATGDFVFNCKAIYSLGGDGVTLHRPAIFSGSMFGALEAVREAFGPLRLDAIGYCGKWGQQVPSSGGSHYFLVLDPHPQVRLGGR